MASAREISLAPDCPVPERQQVRAAAGWQRRLLSGGLIMMASSVTVAGLNFAYNVAMAHALGPAEFGHVAAIVSLVLMASSVTLAFQIVCAKFIARNRSNGAKAQVFHALRKKAWKISVVVAAAIALASPLIADYMRFPNAWMIVLIAASVAFYIPLGVKRGSFQGLCRFPRLASNFTIEAAAKLVLAIILVRFFGAMGAVMAIMLSVIVAYLLPPPSKEMSAAPEPGEAADAREGRQAIVFFAGQVLILNLDLILVKHFFPPAEAGLYAAVALVGRVLFYASWSVIAAMFPVTAEGGDKKDSKHMLLVPLGLVISMFAGFLGMLAIAPNVIMKSVFGPGFAGAEPLLGFYALNTGIYAVAVALMAYEMSRRVANTGWLQLLFAGVLLVAIYSFHDSLRQVLTVQLVTMVLLLLAVIIPTLRIKSAPARLEAAA